MEKGLKLNKPKCKFLTKTLSFFGQIFSDAGIRPDPKRVKDLQDAPVPTNVHEVCSFLRMVNYSSKYIPNFATTTEPLRTLFDWTKEHQEAFDMLKNALTSAPCVAYFHKQKETIVLVDASPGWHFCYIIATYKRSR